MKLAPKKFQQKILDWFKHHGRRNLPWQQSQNPYYVWVSEIMLQQTQVKTVIPYFQRFIECHPNIFSLANAELDEVLHNWAGLGYYARARNLHATAKTIVERFKGKFPQDITTLIELPGIGRSTAGAIRSLGFNQPAPILDGNVKRFFARFFAVKGWPGQATVLKKLWDLAQGYVPDYKSSDYTQALMDIGAMICTPKTPSCSICPVKNYCKALEQEAVDAYPSRKPNTKLPLRRRYFFLFYNKNNQILLEKRPPAGIWGGLWSLPECESELDIKTWCKKNYSLEVEKSYQLPSFLHIFTHFRLEITPIIAKIKIQRHLIMESQHRVWYNLDTPATKGMPTPVRKLLLQFKTYINDTHLILPEAKERNRRIRVSPIPKRIG